MCTMPFLIAPILLFLCKYFSIYVDTEIYFFYYFILLGPNCINLPLTVFVCNHVVAVGVVVRGGNQCCIVLFVLRSWLLPHFCRSPCRRYWHPLFAGVMRQMFVWGGLVWEFKGKRAPRSQAPLLVCGPHHSFLDGVIVLLSGGQAPCTKLESKYIPLLGSKWLPLYVY